MIPLLSYRSSRGASCSLLTQIRAVWGIRAQMGAQTRLCADHSARSPTDVRRCVRRWGCADAKGDLRTLRVRRRLRKGGQLSLCARSAHDRVRRWGADCLRRSICAPDPAPEVHLRRLSAQGPPTACADAMRRCHAQMICASQIGAQMDFASAHPDLRTPSAHDPAHVERLEQTRKRR